MKHGLRDLIGAYIVGVLAGLSVAAVVVEARGIDMSKAGVSLWIFLAVGACIILLQAVPAFIMVWSFIVSRRKDG